MGTADKISKTLHKITIEKRQDKGVQNSLYKLHNFKIENFKVTGSTNIQEISGI